jgi:hypothetical protein
LEGAEARVLLLHVSELDRVVGVVGLLEGLRLDFVDEIELILRVVTLSADASDEDLEGEECCCG